MSYSPSPRPAPRARAASIGAAGPRHGRYPLCPSHIADGREAGSRGHGRSPTCPATVVVPSRGRPCPRGPAGSPTPSVPAREKVTTLLPKIAARVAPVRSGAATDLRFRLATRLRRPRRAGVPPLKPCQTTMPQGARRPGAPQQTPAPSRSPDSAAPGTLTWAQPDPVGALLPAEAIDETTEPRDADRESLSGTSAPRPEPVGARVSRSARCPRRGLHRAPVPAAGGTSPSAVAVPPPAVTWRGFPRACRGR